MHAAVLREGNEGAALGPGDADIGEAALFLQPGAALLVQRALAAGTGLPPSRAGTPCRIPAPWRECSVMMLTLSSSADCSTSMTSEMCSRKPARFSNSPMERTSSLRLSRRPCGLRALVVLPHLGVARLVQHDFGQLRVRQARPSSAASGRSFRSASRSAVRVLSGSSSVRLSRLRRAVERDALRRGQCSCMRLTEVSPMPRLGVLMMRSKARSLSGEATILR